jgi:hypothetical protein
MNGSVAGQHAVAGRRRVMQSVPGQRHAASREEKPHVLDVLVGHHTLQQAVGVHGHEFLDLIHDGHHMDTFFLEDIAQLFQVRGQAHPGDRKR